MNKLHLFNPENDLALGLDCRHYTPPPHASALHRAGALLPAWWASAGDAILAPALLKADLEYLHTRFGLEGEIVSNHSGYEPSPWGWSLDAVRQFENAGVADSLLPSDLRIDALRELSHRRSSVKLLQQIGAAGVVTLETSDPDEVVDMESRWPGCYIKSPWSGSGRGVFCARGLSYKVLRDKAAGIIHRQGSVMVERGLDKVMDCAALYRASQGKVELGGLSMFVTENRGMYGGNVVAGQQWIRAEIVKHVGDEVLDHALNALQKALTELLGAIYEGWLGVDMLVWRDSSGAMRLHPCIELNLRMTMGVVAMAVSERLSVSTPGLMAWQRSASVDSLTLLPPREGFALTLTDFANG
ncbi:MAG: hypothetical protein NC339_04315 [Muribaculaceae bacterium]|nr:hypothetical protein [Muribaculaceae bacterium]